MTGRVSERDGKVGCELVHPGEQLCQAIGAVTDLETDDHEHGGRGAGG